jgi:hypothetical protein
MTSRYDDDGGGGPTQCVVSRANLTAMKQIAVRVLQARRSRNFSSDWKKLLPRLLARRDSSRCIVENLR